MEHLQAPPVTRTTVDHASGDPDVREHHRDILDRIDRLDRPDRFQWCSGEELRYHLDPGPDWAVVDLGSGTGFYTGEVAPLVDTVYAVDILEEMHDLYREKGLPSNVVPVTAAFDDLPFDDGELDGAIAVKTFHHELDAAVDEVARVLRPGARFVVVDWSATGAGTRTPPVEEDYFDLATVQSRLLEAGFAVRTAQERWETFLVVAERRSR